ncbi:LexA family transcriptional regulator [Phytobacter diazotrophicus]|jgi:repressor LexA|uniref:LexA family protein n=1 Tax=Phytobacter diazotrophicus TaxID=395631 RepID=UPI00232B9772|nr:DNA-binding protein [Phytobacter diazotrophicus]MDC0728575.1 DNA-binding protein [Phytobacter diazotrophicus]MDC0735772.1 DNA-binding protein [Phytobacter diazotrophicus]MDV2875781.1 DNA-binding protein [Phytobacter diazotrophicus]
MAHTTSKTELPLADTREDAVGLLSLQNLPPRQQEVYDLLLFYIRQHGYPPTMKELAGLIGVRSVNAVAEHLKALERKGLITQVRGAARGITIVGNKEPVLAVQLLNALLNHEPGARARAEKFVRLYEGGQ